MLDSIKGEVLPVHDHGFIRVVDWMGDDAAIVQAARVSYAEGTKTLREDEGLIRYLMRKRHTTPFEMCEIKLHLKMPIFVARQWIRHRTANVNEVSARYSVLAQEFYVPDPLDVGIQSTVNKQGRGKPLDDDKCQVFVGLTQEAGDDAFATYHAVLEQGVARELARINLPLSTYTEMYWKIDLHNLLHFLELRCDEHAQQEIRDYADAILQLVVAEWVPMTYRAFLDYRLNAFTLSGPAVEVVRRWLKGHAVDRETAGLTDREWDELREALS